MWELDYKESWAPKNRYFWTVVLEKTLESPLNCKEIQPVHCKGNQSWVFTGRTDAEAETPILWPPVANNWLIGKDPDAGKDWRQEEKRMTEDEMVGWHHWLDEHEFEQVLGVGDGQGSLVSYSPQGHKESGTTEWEKLSQIQLSSENSELNWMLMKSSINYQEMFLELRKDIITKNTEVTIFSDFNFKHYLVIIPQLW